VNGVREGDQAGSAAATAAAAARISAQFPRPPIWNRIRPPGSRWSRQRRSTSSCSASQCKQALETIRLARSANENVRTSPSMKTTLARAWVRRANAIMSLSASRP